MGRLLNRLLLLALVGGGALAFLSWPRINDVETGRTPEYPDLVSPSYLSGVGNVTKAAKAVLGRLPRWRLVGEGTGPAGAEIQAVRKTRILRFEDDVTIRIRREGGQTRVSVRSKSRFGAIDFGQNARNIREFLAELERELG